MAAQTARIVAGRAWRNLNRRVSRLWLDRRLRPGGPALVRLGTGYGGWRVPADLPRGAVCYCVGVGQDASFDIALHERGMEVHAFDPTPISVDYMARTAPAGLAFHPWGLWSRDETVTFHAPFDPSHNYFVEDLHGMGAAFEAPCYTLGTMMAKLGHARVDVLKIDIEGSWHPAILQFLSAGIRPGMLGVEFDSPAPLWRVRPVMRALEAAGYRAVHREKDNVTLLGPGHFA